MPGIQKITGSLDGTEVITTFGSVFALNQSNIEISGSTGEIRFTLPQGQLFTDTGTNISNNGFAKIVVYGQSEVIIQSA